MIPSAYLSATEEHRLGSKFAMEESATMGAAEIPGYIISYKAGNRYHRPIPQTRNSLCITLQASGASAGSIPAPAVIYPSPAVTESFYVRVRRHCDFWKFKVPSSA
ncbi:hypothetical protein NMY22_g9459 [Coprinellus aureogranulatus]|nr:hypothetical protein NMY22_g9459 [Coprinellus aureogranulatus]